MFPAHHSRTGIPVITRWQRVLGQFALQFSWHPPENACYRASVIASPCTFLFSNSRSRGQRSGISVENGLMLSLQHIRDASLNEVASLRFAPLEVHLDSARHGERRLAAADARL